MSIREMLLFGFAPIVSFLGLFILLYLERQKCYRVSMRLSLKSIQYVINVLEDHKVIRGQLEEALYKMIRVLRTRPFASHRFIADYTKMLMEEGMLSKHNLELE